LQGEGAKSKAQLEMLNNELKNVNFERLKERQRLENLMREITETYKEITVQREDVQAGHFCTPYVLQVKNYKNQENSNIDIELGLGRSKEVRWGDEGVKAGELNRRQKIRE
jgi:hypothetical protein